MWFSFKKRPTESELSEVVRASVRGVAKTRPKRNERLWSIEMLQHLSSPYAVEMEFAIDELHEVLHQHNFWVQLSPQQIARVFMKPLAKLLLFKRGDRRMRRKAAHCLWHLTCCSGHEVLKKLGIRPWMVGRVALVSSRTYG